MLRIGACFAVVLGLCATACVPTTVSGLKEKSDYSRSSVVETPFQKTYDTIATNGRLCYDWDHATREERNNKVAGVVLMTLFGGIGGGVAAAASEPKVRTRLDPAGNKGEVSFVISGVARDTVLLHVEVEDQAPKSKVTTYTVAAQDQRHSTIVGWMSGSRSCAPGVSTRSMDAVPPPPPPPEKIPPDRVGR